MEDLTARWKDWAFVMAEYTVKNLRKRVEDMVKPIEGEPTGPAIGVLPAPAPTPAPAPQ